MVDDGDKGLLWRLPVVKTQDLGKLGPGFGIGAGCGVGFGFGLMGGAALGAGVPGLQLGFGLGAGCGIGVGFGYGFGRGIAYDENRKYSNVGKLFGRPLNLSNLNDVEPILDELVINTKKLIKAAKREMDKWR
ncbi:hypothetical protein J5N97_012680 [Dioscorea zingiberensis]|uniref:Uncharacterized protein n=1 Tax=Dioscorea zingiberensis TaxID=325984 RepID=A0A9D5HHY3_9LILI|nr:hypothetical protein J5N97_012680 [Dioscorea zingiberensis]